MVLTTRECLLNPNRNPGLTEAAAERILKEYFGAGKVLWLDRGLINDHTDGHIDNVARFLGRGRVACQAPSGADDPHAERLHEAAAALRAMTDAGGAVLMSSKFPSPGRVEDEDGRAMPASHMNYVIGNRAVVVPDLWHAVCRGGRRAQSRLLFPERKVVGLPATAILSGGGAFHCITPAPALEVAVMSTITVAGLQAVVRRGSWRPISSQVSGLVREAAGKGAQVILPPELFQGPYFCKTQEERWFARSLSLDRAPCVAAMAALAKELGVAIPVSIFERDGPRYYNSLVMVDAGGRGAWASIARATFRMGPAIRRNIISGPAIPVSRSGRPNSAGSASASAGTSGSPNRPAS